MQLVVKNQEENQRRNQGENQQRNQEENQRRNQVENQRRNQKESQQKNPKKKSVRKSTTKVKANSKLGCVDLCKKGTASQQKKYCNRNSPPYPGAVCLAAGKTGMRGNDGEYYINKSGRWVKQK